MPVTLSIKHVPEDLADRLRKRAEDNHRSLQGELMCILEASVGQRRLTIQELLSEVKALGLKTGSESVEMIRQDRDGR